MRHFVVAASLLLCPLVPAAAQVSVEIDLPSSSIGFSQPVYPQLVAVPGYPVYYDPGSPSNYFFYDGMFWVYESDTWYASSWYNGPWGMVEPEFVPLFILRVPVSYYRQPPAYFRGWRGDAPPRWGEHWGNGWERQHSGWDRWNRRQVPAPAPLPVYQRQFAGNRYPQRAQQQALRRENYNHAPHDAAVRHVYQAQSERRGVAAAQAPGRSQPSRLQAPRVEPARQPAPHAAPARQPAPRPEPARQPARAEPARQPAPRAEPTRQPARAEPARQPAPRAEPARSAAREQPARAQPQGGSRGHQPPGNPPAPKGEQRPKNDERGQGHER